MVATIIFFIFNILKTFKLVLSYYAIKILNFQTKSVIF